MLSLYVHIPFCIRKCLYCGFYSVPYTEGDAKQYIEVLSKEAALYAELLSNRTFGSVYIGGGTPTALSSAHLERILAEIRSCFVIARDAEITVEANPGTVSMGTLDALLCSGVNRLSIGVQSFSDRILMYLGRVHSGRDAEDAVRLARKAGFGNIGIDLIYGIPGRTLDEWREDLDLSLDLGPEHISTYCLSLDEGTHFSRMAKEGGLRLPDEDDVLSQYELADSVLVQAGYGRYEISNFSLPGFECRHNLNYWQRGEYLGLGASAWSFIDGKRWMNTADLDAYLDRVLSGAGPVAFSERVGKDQAAREALMLGLRTADGLDMEMFRHQHGEEAFMQVMNTVPSLAQRGIVSLSRGRLRLTARGMLIADSVTERLFV